MLLSIGHEIHIEKRTQTYINGLANSRTGGVGDKGQGLIQP
jgi:hypothetical protein